jgi:hypothetical protein
MSLCTRISGNPMITSIQLSITLARMLCDTSVRTEYVLPVTSPVSLLTQTSFTTHSVQYIQYTLSVHLTSTSQHHQWIHYHLCLIPSIKLLHREAHPPRHHQSRCLGPREHNHRSIRAGRFTAHHYRSIRAGCPRERHVRSRRQRCN